MKINLIRLANSIDPKTPYLKDSEMFIEDVNNELFEYGHELVNNAKTAQFSIIFIETGGSESKFKQIYKKLKKPIILLSDSLNNSLPACFEIHTFLDSLKIPHTMIFGEAKHIAESIDKIANIYSGISKIEGSTLGVIGKPSDWLIASNVEYKKVKDIFDISLKDIDINELIEESKVADVSKFPLLKELSNKCKDKASIEGALKIYVALKNIIKKYKLSAITVRCFDLIKELNNTACLAFALLNKEGIVATCEGDIPTLISMYIVRVASGLPSFQVNPSKVIMEEDSMIFSHCTVPLNMCTNYELTTHFESGLGIGVKGTLENKDVTIFKIAPNLKDITLFTAKIIENTSYKNYCRTQIKVKFEDHEIYPLINNPFGNHLVVVYGDIIESLLPFLQLYNLFPEQF